MTAAPASALICTATIFVVTDLQRSLAIYRDKLGFEINVDTLNGEIMQRGTEIPKAPQNYNFGMGTSTC